MNSEARIQELEAKVSELTALVERMAPALRGATAADTPPQIDTTAVEVVETPTSSRRGMLKLAGAAAAGAVAAVAANSMPAAALDGDPITIAEATSTTAASRETTSVIYSNTLTPEVPGFIFGTTSPANIFVARDTPGGIIFFNGSSSAYPAASAGYAYRTVANGMYGYTGMSGAGVVGSGGGAGSVGVLARGAGANLELLSEGTAPAARSDAHRLGQVVCDSTGSVWLCVAAGTPGTWRKLAGATTAGAFHALNPGRVYDSRAALPLQGAIVGGNNRTITVADLRDPATGAVSIADYVPAGATAVAANITIVSLSGAGFLTVNPGGVTSVGASTINWSAPGQVLANGVTLTLNTDRQLTVVAGGGGSTEFIVDISGYYL